MEIILLEKIRNLGALGDKVHVKSGYGRNFLIPTGKAVYATAASIKKFEERRSELEKIAAEHVAAAEARKKSIEDLGTIEIVVKAGEEGKLFGSIGTRDIADAITAAGAEVGKHEIDLPTGALRHVGEYDLVIELHSDVVANVKVNVTSPAES